MARLLDFIQGSSDFIDLVQNFTLLPDFVPNWLLLPSVDFKEGNHEYPKFLPQCYNLIILIVLDFWKFCCTVHKYNKMMWKTWPVHTFWPWHYGQNFAILSKHYKPFLPIQISENLIKTCWIYTHILVVPAFDWRNDFSWPKKSCSDQTIHIFSSDEPEPSWLKPLLKLKVFQLGSARLVTFFTSARNWKLTTNERIFKNS